MRFVFLGGCRRSGTTLLQKALGAHSRIAGGSEFLFTPAIAGLYRRMAGRYAEHYARRIEGFYDAASLAAAFRRFYAGFFDEVRQRKPEATLIAEKTPANVYEAATLLRLFPDSRFVHALRDGRDVVASLADVRGRLQAQGIDGYNRRSFRLRAACGEWNHAARTHFAIEADPELAPRYRALRYEELVRAPRPVLTRLLDFLDLGLEEACLSPERLDAGRTGLTVDGVWYTREMDRQGFSAARIGRGRRDLPPGRRLLANLLMAENLDRLSYPVAPGWALAHRALRRLGRGPRAAGGRDPR